MEYSKDSLNRSYPSEKPRGDIKVKGKSIGFRPPADLRKLLISEAVREGRSLNNLLVTILRRYFAGRLAAERRDDGHAS